MRRLQRLSILGTLLAAFALRVFRLGAQELRGDEAFGYFFTRNSYLEIVTETLALREPHPVLSYFVQKAWMAAAGTSEFALRFGGVFFGVLAVALLYRLIVDENLPPITAVVGALLLAISPYAIWHSQDARMYSMSMALTLGSTVLAVRWLRSRKLALGASYVAVTLAALQTHYFAAFIVVAQNVYVVTQLIARRVTRQSLWRWITTQLALWILYAPWLFRARRILIGYGGNGDSPRLLEAVVRALSVFAAGETIPTSQQVLWAVLAFAAALLGVVALGRSRRYRPAAWLFSLYLAMPVLAAWYGAQSRPIFDERYLAAAAPPFFALAASAVTPIVEKKPRTAMASSLRMYASAVLVILLLIGATQSLVRYHGDPQYSKSRGWRELARSLERMTACMPADRVRLAQNYPDPTLWYYFDGAPGHLVLPPLANDEILARAEVESLVAEDVQRILFIEQPMQSWDATGIGKAALRAEYILAAVERSTDWPISVFVRPRPGESLDTHKLETGATLTHSSVHPSSLAPGGAAVVFLEWSPGDSAKGKPLKAFVQLINADGQLVAQEDRFLPTLGEGAPRRPVMDAYGILLPPDLPGGEYRLIAGVYLPDSEGVERIRTADGADHVELGKLTVVAGGSTACEAVQEEPAKHD